MTGFIHSLPMKRRSMPGLTRASAAAALACLLLGLAACGGGGGGSSGGSGSAIVGGDGSGGGGNGNGGGNTGNGGGNGGGNTGNGGGNGGNGGGNTGNGNGGGNTGNGGGGQTPEPVIGGTVIDLTNLTGTPGEKETQYNAREQSAEKTEPGSNNVLELDGDGEPYDTDKFWTIDGSDVTTKRAGLTLQQRSNFAPSPPTGYTVTYNVVNWPIPSLDHLGIRYPVPQGDVPKNIGSEIVLAYTDKADATDTDYIDFGVWRLIDLESDDILTVRFGSYARATSSTTTDLSGVTGTATYNGYAVGRYTHTGSGGGFGWVGNGAVTLTADFGTSRISGTITDLQSTAPGTPAIDDTWEITLAETGFDNQGIIARAETTGDAAAARGWWRGAFQLGDDGSGSAVQPPAVTGKFTAHFDDGSVVGAFGAKK